MTSCCLHKRDTARFFGWFARSYRRRFGREGLEPSQKQLVEGLMRAGIGAATLLEIGCGTGYLHQFLLQRGAARAMGVDLSEKMLDEARGTARERGLSGRTDYRAGDFVDLADAIAPADAVILDKVICCYPDAGTLVRESSRKAARVYAFTIPRNRWWPRLGIAIGAMLLALIRCGFRPYVHDPAMIDRWLAEARFERVYENQTLIWLTRVYSRRADQENFLQEDSRTDLSRRPEHIA
ncbi:MAG: methyltransferase domain-containing protein [Betaproteobacteria bacterium]|nr:methyltransferase domain-containing protein [Betaproteobacteria bacterium]